MRDDHKAGGPAVILGRIESDMDKATYTYFIEGLARAIKRAGYKHKDFAEGLMNPVSLSRQLNFKMQMQEGLRDKCAGKLGMSVAELVALGKAEHEQEQAIAAATIAPAPEVVPPTDYVPYHEWTTEQLVTMTPSEMTIEINAYIDHVRQAQTELFERMLSRGRMLAEARNRCRREVLQQRQVFEAMVHTVRIVTRDRKTIYENRARVALSRVLPENEHGCPAYCEHDTPCPILEVVTTGQPELRSFVHEDTIYHATFTPIFDAQGQVELVVAVGRPLTRAMIESALAQLDALEHTNGPGDDRT